MDCGQFLRFDRFTLDIARGCLKAGDMELKLRPKTFDVLAYLARNPGRFVSKEEILDTLWRDVVVTDNSVAQCIREIRTTLGDVGERFIRTVPRRGYVFVAPVATVALSAAGDRSVWGADAASVSVPRAISMGRRSHGVDAGRGPRQRWPSGILALTLALALSLAAALAIWNFRLRPISPPPAGGLTLAVLPFESLIADQHLAQGLAEDLITALSRFRDVTVLARNSSFRYRGEADLAKVGADLGTGFVVRGSVARDGDLSRVTVQLVDVRSGAVRWGARFDRPMTTLFALQDEVAERVVSVLVAQARHFAFDRVRSRPPSTLEAYELVLKARLALSNYGAKGSEESLALLEQALRLDPGYAAAWGTLTRVKLRLFLHPIDERFLAPSVLEQALEAAQKAVALDPDSSHAHAALGYARLWKHQYAESIASLRQAIEMNRNDATTFFYYGDALGRVGEQRASIEALERSRQLDPFAPTIVTGSIARGYVMLGEYEKALTIARDCTERAPDAPACLIMRSISAAALGHEGEAQLALRQLLTVYPSYTIGRYARRFKYDQDEQAFIALLRQAGFPE